MHAMREDLEAFAASLLAELCERHPLGVKPELHWRNLRVTAGSAHFRTNAISLSKLVLTDTERVRTTLIHEYAHLLAVKRHGTKAAAHGKEWRAAMLELGLDPVVCHRYEVRRNTNRQQVTYLCLKCGEKLPRSRKLPKRKLFVHATCGGRLRLHEVVRLEEVA